jgi:hypothetical protein
MSLPKVVARSVPDNPLLVRKRLIKDSYVPRTIYYTKIITQPRIVFEETSAQDDHQMVETVEREIIWSEVRLVKRGRTIEKKGRQIYIPSKTHRQKTIRAEFADAKASPLSYVKYDKLVKLVKQETRYWKHHNMCKGNIRPLVLVLLGIRENEDGTYHTFVRDAFYIKQFDATRMVIVDSKDIEIELYLEKDVFKSGLTSQFILFLPANVHFYDDQGQELL